MNCKFWPEENLRLVEVDEGLKVIQGEHEYLARNWRLSDDVITFVNICLSHGASCAIRYSHPKPSNRTDGVDYIGFSRSPNERCICAIDQFSPKTKKTTDRIIRTIFEKHYRIALEGADIPWEWQSSTAKNIHVSFGNIDAAVFACIENAEAVEISLGTRRWEAKKAHIGFVTEAILEDWMVKNWKSIFIDLRIPLEFKGRQVCHSDILAFHKQSGTYVVFELKRGPQGISVLTQLDSYINGRLRRKVIGVDIPVAGAIVAHSFDEQIVLEASKKPYPIALFEFSEKLDTPALRCISSNWPSSWIMLC